MKDILSSVVSFSIKTVILLVFLGFFLTIIYFALFRPAVKNLFLQERFSVEGTAKKYMQPDLALVNVGATIEGLNPAEVKKSADKALNATRDQVLAVGVKAEKIRSDYSITPKYDKDYLKIIGYTARASMEVKTADFTQVDKILEAAITNGLNQIDNVSFIIEDPIKAKEALRTEAIAAAKAKAEKLANETGMSLGKVVNISEGYAPYYDYRNSYKANAIMESAAVASDAGTSEAINPGETEIQMTVVLTYETN